MSELSGLVATNNMLEQFLLQLVYRKILLCHKWILEIMLLTISQVFYILEMLLQCIKTFGKFRMHTHTWLVWINNNICPSPLPSTPLTIIAASYKTLYCFFDKTSLLGRAQEVFVQTIAHLWSIHRKAYIVNISVWAVWRQRSNQSFRKN